MTARLGAQGGVWLTRDATADGMDDKAIRRMLRGGEWHKLRHGAYCAAQTWQDADADCRRLLIASAVYRTAKPGAVLSHFSAALTLGAPVWEAPDETHLTRQDRRAGRREAGVVQHRGVLRPEDMIKRDIGWVTSGTRTALDCSTVADVEHSLVIVNGLLALGETTMPQLERRREAMRQVPGMLTTDLVLRLADGRCESAGESRTFFLFWKAGLPAPIPQYEIKDRAGKVVARVDFAWPELGVFLEFDGLAKYSTYLRPGETARDAVVREKRREELICGLTGWRCIRLIWADLAYPARTADRIRRVLAGKPWVS